MKMTFDWADLVQERLQIMAFGPDDYSPVAFIGGVISKEYERTQWQEGVDMIYRLLKIGMLKFTEYADDGSPAIRQPIELAVALASQDPFNDEAWVQAKEMPHWYVPLLSTTAACKELMQKHSIDNLRAPFCVALIEEIESLFEAAGLAWSEKPLIPIKST